MKLTINWQPDPTKKAPLYQQITDYFLKQITTGNWVVGDQLPNQRRLAQQFNVNRSTLASATAILHSYGVISATTGGGTKISSNTWSLLMSRPALNWHNYASSGQFVPNQPTIQTINQLETNDFTRLSTGELAPSLFPKKLMRQALTTVTAELNSLNYLPPEGLYELRVALADYLKQWQIKVNPENILITSGSLQALQLISVGLLTHGATIFTEKVSYLNSLEVFQSVKSHLVGLPFDNEGVAFWQIPQSNAQQLLYTIPSYQNPTGLVMSLKRRQDLLAFAAKRHLPIIEDSAYQDLWFAKRPPLPLKSLDTHQTVLYLGTASKFLAPGLRLGWIVGPQAIIRRLSDVKMQTDYGASSLAQLTLTKVLQSSAFPTYLNDIREQLKQRCLLALTALQDYLTPYATWQQPTGGFYIWLQLNAEISVNQLFHQAIGSKILFNPGKVYGNQATQMIRLSFAYTEPIIFRKTICRLQQLIKQQLETTD
ncbi:GntR family transcriptional regulator [Loigolactobacillus backii]|uniref:aminotransferase-like domain-containing protein n=1 Tax=Loigolactobacillus backii TaxID=375175 RepID=UPI000C1CB466|nr:PLP-dependent aminotransferase family protein [Loigolactobacillus backii]PIO82709.1 GntR family transcriptional regulator [Loigolactobacillus backii]